MSKYGHRTHNWFEAIVNKLGGEKAGDRFLRDELTVCELTRSWREHNGVIYFSVISNGKTGSQWTDWFKARDLQPSERTMQLLNSPDFTPTKGVIYEIAVLRAMLWNDNDRTHERIRRDAHEGTYYKGNAVFEQGLLDPNPEVACLICEKFSDKELENMSLWAIVVMHKPINYYDSLLLFSTSPNGLCTVSGKEHVNILKRNRGFAFVVSRTSI